MCHFSSSTNSFTCSFNINFDHEVCSRAHVNRQISHSQRDFLNLEDISINFNPNRRLNSIMIGRVITNQYPMVNTVTG